MDMTYDDVVGSEETTCFACPLQVEGSLKSFDRFFFHYRHGYASLEVGVHETGKEVVNESDPMGDGYLPRDQYKRVFMELLSDLAMEAFQ